ncbi:hypothetical protein BLNAU_21318 [Blattamonas nauphoetae]|uniref:Uncharacterized protein n=1 Tax=Blattamonas nauphoetae TaxID=2049346 RepID=A0ABQ9X0G6_9EUKA|nr:hypothetical protein BLNAU_21318 [Blattamonas nauphoetae]
MSELLLPLVCFTPSFAKLPADPDALLSLSSETCGDELRTLSIFGTGIDFSSKSFSVGTGPLFAFSRRNVNHTETLRWTVDLTLSQSNMQNMTSGNSNISSPLVRSVSQHTMTSYEHFSVATDLTEITGIATFLYCTVKGITGTFRGAINQETSDSATATLDISWCSFQLCSIPGLGWNGVVSQLGSASNIFIMTNSVMKDNFVEHGGGILGKRLLNGQSS